MYLKYDKKLILEIESFKFLTSNEESTEKLDTKSIYNSISKIPKLLDVFEKIDIERLSIGKSAFTITLDENYLYLDNNDVNLSASLEFAGSQIRMIINSLYFKQIGLAFFGDAKVDTRKEIMNYFGTYKYQDLDGELNLQFQENILDFFVNTTHSIKSISFLKEFFRLDKVAEAWMYDNVTGDINLNYLYGKFDIENLKLFEDDMKGNVTIDNAKIQFNKNAKPVKTPKLTIDYKGDNLYFDLEKPTYNNSSLEGSKVYINHLTSLKKGVVVVDLKTDANLSDDILEILKSYKINLPIRQLDGKSDSSLVLKIPYSIKNKMEVDGVFEIENAKMKLNSFEFFAHKAKVVLKDNIVDIVSSELSYQEILDASLKLKIDTKTHKATGDAKIRKFQIDSQTTNLVSLKDYDTSLDIDFNANTIIDLKDLKTLLEVDKEKIYIKIDDLSILNNYSEVLKSTNINSGKLEIKLYDVDDIKFYLDVNNLNYPIRKDGQEVDKMAFNGIVTKEKTQLFNLEQTIQIDLDNKKPVTLKLDGYDIDLSNNNESSLANNTLPQINLELKNSSIRLDKKHKYKVNWANININKNNIKFDAQATNLDLPIAKDNRQVSTLTLKGSYKDNLIKLKTTDNTLELDYDISKDKISMWLDNYDVLYNTNKETDEKNKTIYYIEGKNSNIIINEKHVAIANEYNFVFEKDFVDIRLSHDNTKFKYHKDSLENIIFEAQNMNDEFLNSLFGKNLIQGGSVNIISKGKNGVIQGVTEIDNSKVVDLAILNNLLILINTSPGLINPLLAVPSVVGMVSNGGFNLNGYRIVEGKIEFIYNTNTKYLNMPKIFTKGNGIDFDGFMTIDFNTSEIDSKLKLLFFKNYSKIVGAIPVVNYILLGDENRVSTQVEIYGTLDEPKYKTVFVEEGIKAPVNLLKRIITSPLKLFESDSKEEKKE